MLFPEDFLQYVWKFRLFDRLNLRTTAGEELEVYSSGLHNADSGPDFHNARIRIGETVWAGNVELHLHSSDWRKHNHSTDHAYNNIILHVVYTDDEPLSAYDGRQVPTLELHDRVPEKLYHRYHQLAFGQQTFIPCEGSIHTVDELTLKNWLTRVLIERLEKRSANVLAALELNRGDWEETFYQLLAANFGFKTNALPFELLAKSLPQIILAKHKNDPGQIEALVFGQAGFLGDDFEDEYPQKLKQEYNFLQKKYGLVPMEKHLWKFMRMRPQNFPTIRLAQFAAVIIKSNHLFSKILELKEVASLRNLFTDISVNNYWANHYRFDTVSKPSSKSLGQSSIDILLLNTFVVTLFSYGHHRGQEYFVSRSLKLLESLPAENNHITVGFEAINVKAGTAFDSQTLIELKNNYCDWKKCLHCAVGNKILKLA
jgi:hypothetical protein